MTTMSECKAFCDYWGNDDLWRAAITELLKYRRQKPIPDRQLWLAAWVNPDHLRQRSK